MQERSYAKRAWALLTQQKGWIKPVLVLSAANFVPIVGPIGASGYALEWARLTAWGVDAAPKQKNVKVGDLIASGFRALVVVLGWGVCLGLVMGILQGIAGVIPGIVGGVIQAIVGLALFVVQMLYGPAIVVATIRTSIYEKIGAGYRVDRILDMIRRDMSGFMHLVLIQLVAGVVMTIVVIILIFILVISFLPAVIAAEGASSEYAVMMMFMQSLGVVLIFGLVLGYALSVVFNSYTLVFYNAVALWMRQFDVPSWGRSEDPLPDTVGYGNDAMRPQSQEPVRTVDAAEVSPEAAPQVEAAPQAQSDDQPKTELEPQQRYADVTMTSEIEEEADSQIEPELTFEPEPEHEPIFETEPEFEPGAYEDEQDVTGMESVEDADDEALHTQATERLHVQSTEALPVIAKETAQAEGPVAQEEDADDKDEPVAAVVEVPTEPEPAPEPEPEDEVRPAPVLEPKSEVEIAPEPAPDGAPEAEFEDEAEPSPVPDSEPFDEKQKDIDTLYDELRNVLHRDDE